MTSNEQTQKPETKVVTRYGLLTRYEAESSVDLENNETGSMKNFPQAFIPMEELSESAADA